MYKKKKGMRKTPWSNYCTIQFPDGFDSRLDLVRQRVSEGKDPGIIEEAVLSSAKLSASALDTDSEGA
jgi:hypothetical protein